MADAQGQGLIYAGTTDFLYGQDASTIPDRIPDNAYYQGINVSVRRGSLMPRWGFERLKLKYPEGTVFDPYRRPRTYKEIFDGGKFQALIPYCSGTSKYLVLVVSGVIYFLNLFDDSLSIVPVNDGSFLNSRARRINWTNAGRYLVLYDFPAYPVIIEGTVAKRADPLTYGIPAASGGAFNENRLFIVNSGKEFTAGDPVGSTATPNAPITFEEVLLAGSPYYGQIFRTPTTDQNDPITYAGFLQSTDLSTGIGPLIIGTARSVYAFNSQLERTNWDKSSFGSMLCYNAGIAGPRAAINTNSDMLFLGPDGYVRSLAQSRNEQSSWSRVPLSREVETWFKTWDNSLISLGFAGYFKNKVFFSVNPYRVAAEDFSTFLPISDYAHGGLVVMELDNFIPTQYSGVQNKPTWIGLWTGIRPMDMVTMGDRCFVISKDAYSVNRLYEINPELSYDTADEKIRYVRSRIYTKEFDFTDPFINKEIHSLDVNFDTLQGDFSFDVKYKASHSPYFFPWKTFTHEAPWRTCCVPQGCEIMGFAPHHIRDFTLGAPETDEHSPITNDFYRVFRKIQLQFTVSGKYWEIHEFRIKAMVRPLNDLQSINSEFAPVRMCSDCTDDWFVEEFDLCKVQLT